MWCHNLFYTLLFFFFLFSFCEGSILQYLSSDLYNECFVTKYRTSEICVWKMHSFQRTENVSSWVLMKRLENWNGFSWSYTFLVNFTNFTFNLMGGCINLITSNFQTCGLNVLNESILCFGDIKNVKKNQNYVYFLVKVIILKKKIWL